MGEEKRFITRESKINPKNTAFPYQCPECQSRFKDQEGLKAHFNKKHMEAKEKPK